MRTRLAPLLVVASLAVALSACSSGGGTITIGKSSEAPPTTTGVVDDQTTVDPGASTDDTSVQTIPGSSDGSGVPDIGALPGDMENCVVLGSALSAMGAAAAGQTVDDATKQQIEDAKASLPENIQADVDVVVKAYEKLGSSAGDISAATEAINSPEFRQATTELSEYISQHCGG